MTPSSDIKGLVEALREMSDMRFGVSGKSASQVNDWFNERARQALASISSREGAASFEPNYANMGWEPGDIGASPSTQAEREAVATVLISYDDHTDWPVALEIADEILSLLAPRRTPPDPHPLTALLTRWDNGESVGDLITQYLRGEGDWGPVRVLVGATTRSPSTLPDGWRERVKTALREHHRRVYNEYGAFWFDGELDQMADAIGEVFATGDISKVMEENARLIATVAALKAADAERAEGLAKVQGYRADAEARVRELEEALEPFADFGDFMESETEEFADLDRMNLTPEESECVLGNLFVGAFRRARSLLSRED